MARNAAANSVELLMRKRILSPGLAPACKRPFTTANTGRWNSALETGPWAVRKATRSAYVGSRPGRSASSARFMERISIAVARSAVLRRTLVQKRPDPLPAIGCSRDLHHGFELHLSAFCALVVVPIASHQRLGMSHR